MKYRKTLLECMCKATRGCVGMKKPTGSLRKVQQRGSEIIFMIVSSNEVQWGRGEVNLELKLVDATFTVSTISGSVSKKVILGKHTIKTHFSTFPQSLFC